MDMIRGCEVDLRSCGKLLRQHEFIINIGRRKAQRRIFLFEKICLFAKTKKLPSGDIYQYKNSWLVRKILEKSAFLRNFIVLVKIYDIYSVFSNFLSIRKWLFLHFLWTFDG